MLIAIKTIVFFLALLATLWLIEDGVERTIQNLNTDKDEFYVNYSLGKTHTFGIGLITVTVLLWTILYLLSQF